VDVEALLVDSKVLIKGRRGFSVGRRQPLPTPEGDRPVALPSGEHLHLFAKVSCSVLMILRQYLPTLRHHFVRIDIVRSLSPWWKDGADPEHTKIRIRAENLNLARHSDCNCQEFLNN